MIQSQSSLLVADNSGAKKLMCIRIINNTGKYAKVGDVLVAVVKDAFPKMFVKKKDIVRALVVRTCQQIKRETGMTICFSENAAVLINKENVPRGTRVFGPIAREIRDRQFLKIVSLASEVL